jgi:hypothetical protein
MTAAAVIIDNATGEIISDAQPTDTRSGADRFNAWYIPHAREVVRRWRERHPLEPIVKPLADDWRVSG